MRENDVQRMRNVLVNGLTRSGMTQRLASLGAAVALASSLFTVSCTEDRAGTVPDSGPRADATTADGDAVALDGDALATDAPAADDADGAVSEDTSTPDTSDPDGAVVENETGSEAPDAPATDDADTLVLEVGGSDASDSDASPTTDAEDASVEAGPDAATAD